MNAVFVPSQGAAGSLTTGNTTTSVVISTALPGSVDVNQLANRGDGVGYIIRIIGLSAGGSGRICERRIVGNTSGTTPTIYLDAALDFTPASGDRYELLSGAWYVLTTGALKEWRRLDVATATVSAALSTTNLVGTVGTSFTDFIPLDEQYVPAGNYPGEGFIRGAGTYDSGTDYVKFCLTATATAAGTLTGQAAAGDATVTANQFRNFQIRIVKDTANPTAVGQRRRITSHTAGASPVYTLASNWTVTPSSTASYVIENDNDKLIFLTNSTTVYNYNHTANTWDTTTWAARGTAPTAGGGSFQIFGITDATGLSKNSMIYSYRGVGTGGNPIDVLDIAAGSTGVWSSFAATPNFTSQILSTPTAPGCVYDPVAFNGRYMYFMYFSSGTSPIALLRLDVKARIILPYASIPIAAGLTSDQVNNKLGLGILIDGGSIYSFLYLRKPQSSAGELYQCPIIV